MSEFYAVYVQAYPNADNQFVSEVATISNRNAIDVKAALAQGGTLVNSLTEAKARQLAQALGLLGLTIDLSPTLAPSYFQATAKLTPTQMQSRARKHPFILGVALTFLFVGILGWSPWRSQAAPLPGMMVPSGPLQAATDAKPWNYQDYLITPLAGYDVTARVLSKRDYPRDKSSSLSPVDFALGWGVMSDSAVLANLQISQSGRWFYVSWKNASVDANQVMTHSANTHILPATEDIAKKVKNVQRNQIVHLQGYLVEVTKRDGFLWRSSLTRADTGDGSCEVLWVTGVEVVPTTQLQAQR